MQITALTISIHAPSRERHVFDAPKKLVFLFQSTLPRGSDASHRCILLHNCAFQSTLPRGSDIVYLRSPFSLYAFQSTLPRGSDVSFAFRCGNLSISIHAPSRERPAVFPIVGRAKAFQSTLPRGSDLVLLMFVYPLTISIHAPSRERRQASTDNGSFGRISIHAPSRERLCKHSNYHRTPSDFNPRSLAGATVIDVAEDKSTVISIHAPSRERRFFFRTCNGAKDFNPRSLAGATGECLAGM